MKNIYIKFEEYGMDRLQFFLELFDCVILFMAKMIMRNNQLVCFIGIRRGPGLTLSRGRVPGFMGQFGST
jgi:hypothetical protein